MHEGSRYHYVVFMRLNFDGKSIDRFLSDRQIPHILEEL